MIQGQRFVKMTFVDSVVALDTNTKKARIKYRSHTHNV